MFKYFLIIILLTLNCLEAKKSRIDLNSSSIIGNPFALFFINDLVKKSSTSSLSVSSTTPTSDATGVSTVDSLEIIFSDAIDSTSVTNSAITLTDSAGNKKTLSFTTTDTKVSAFANSLSSGTKYTVKVASGDNGVKSSAGLKLSSDYTFNFTTGSSINYSGADGLNIDTTVVGKYPYLISFDSKLFAFWSEVSGGNFQLKGKQLVNQSSQTLVLNNSGSGVDESHLFPISHNSILNIFYNLISTDKFIKYNNTALSWTTPTTLPECSTNTKYKFRVISQGTRLYWIQDEGGCNTGSVINVRYSDNNGTSWTNLVSSTTSGIEGTPVPNSNKYPDIIYFNNQLIATYVSGWTTAPGTASNVLKFTYNSSGTSWNTASVISDVTSNINEDLPFYSRMIVFNTKLYIVYVELIGGIIRERVKVFNGNVSSPSWTAVDNSTGINFDSTKKATRGFPYVFNSKLYIIWSEENTSGVTVVRMKVYNGNDSSPSWTSVDGGGTGGLNVYSDRSGFDPKVTEFNGKLFGIWSESQGANASIFVVQLPF